MGRSRDDIALRLRNWIWYYGVKVCFVDKHGRPLSDEALDRKFLPEELTKGNRPRLFQRMSISGSSPKRPRDDLGGRSIFDAVHEESKPELDQVRTDDQSVLWEILSNSALGPDEFNTIIDDIARNEGWYRANSIDQKLADTFLPNDPAFGFSPHVPNVESSMLAYLQNKPSADHLAVLIAYYKCALAIGYLEWAMKVRRAIDWCINLWRGEEAGVFALPEKMQGLLYNVVYRRVVANNWEEPPLPAENLSHRSFVHAQIEAYSDPRQFRYINSPIVRHSPATRWLARHRKKLQEILRRADHLPPKRRSAYLESVTEEFPAAPTPQTRYCLPVRADFVWDTNEGEPPYLEDGSIWGQRRRRNL